MIIERTCFIDDDDQQHMKLNLIDDCAVVVFRLLTQCENFAWQAKTTAALVTKSGWVHGPAHTL